MAISAQKFLPGSKGTAKPVSQAKISSITLTSSDKKNVNTIRVKTIQIDRILKGTVAADKKRLDDKKREASKKRKEDIETDLEKKPNPNKKLTMPKILPRTGILDWIKNFIGSILVGWVAVRLLKYLPALKGVFTSIVAVGEFIIDWGGKLLNAVVTFIDWGYKIYDGFKGQVGKIFGDDGLKKFDAFMGAFKNVLNAALIIALSVARIGPSLFKGKGGKGGLLRGRPKVTTSGGFRNPLRGRPKVTTSGGFRNPLRGRPRVTGTFGKRAAARILGPIVKRIPIIGALLEFAISWASGDPIGKAAFRGIGSGLGTWIGGALGTLIPVPGVGTAIGMFLGGMGGAELGGVMYDAFFGGKKSPPKKGYAKGGRVKKATRTITPRRGAVAKKKRPPIHIDSVKIDPGEDISVIDKKDSGFASWIQNIFGSVVNTFSPLKFFKDYGDKFGAIPFFGPIISLAVQALVGQKPSDKEYKNAGMGIIGLLAKGLNMGKLIGSIGGVGFAAGGLVDRTVLMKEAKAGEWLGDELKKSLTPIVDETISEIEKNLGKAKPKEKGEPDGKKYPHLDPSTGASMLAPGSVPGGKLNLNQLVHLAKAAGASDSEAIRLASIAMYESGGNSKAHNPKYPDNSYGLWQINMLDEPGYMLGEERRNRYNLSNNEQLWDPVTNAKIALDILRTSGWSAWSTDKLVTQKDLDSAKTALNAPPPQSYSFKKDNEGKPSKSFNIGGSGIVDIGKSLAKQGFSIDEHPDFVKSKAGGIGQYSPGKGRVTNVHKGAGHYEHRALDVTNWGGGSSYKQTYIPVLDSLQKNPNIKMLIHDTWGFYKNGKKSGPGNYGHPTHMHIETYNKGGYVDKDGIVHRGEHVIDIDSSIPKVSPMLLAMNAATTERGVLKAIRDYAPYEAIQSRMIPVPVERMVPVPVPMGSSGGGVAVIGGGGHDPFSSLALNA